MLLERSLVVSWRSSSLTPAAPTRLALRQISSSESHRPRAAPPPPIFQLHNSTIYPFGTPSNSDLSSAWFKSLSWTIESTHQCWAVLASSSSSTKTHLVDSILSQCRFHPISSASYPLLSILPRVEHDGPGGNVQRERSVGDLIKLVGFKMRLEGGVGTGSGFVDYSARYYHIRDEDRITLREHLVKTRSDLKEGQDDILEMAKLLEMERFLDAPLVTLSNGQTRRARILKALLGYPEMLILEEPFSSSTFPLGSSSSCAWLLITLHLQLD